jgi:hypothetical protein
MSFINKIKCNFCATESLEYRGWRVVRTADNVFTLRASTSLSDAHVNGGEDCCSEGCAIKALQQWLGTGEGTNGRRGATPTNPTQHRPE